ncbi:hypothetical protein AAF712_003506 [Marasmius tenuissimus]|uniref:Uncharacterized protein n=1 Tax=Marasmius tenuissimus TaxID=585030 RepID=A0ABR3A655_9AGAR
MHKEEENQVVYLLLALNADDLNFVATRKFLAKSSLTAGKGNRLVLANTEELHDRIDGLCGRIRELEAALRVLQMQVSDEPHPLLTPDLLQLKAPQTNGNNKAQQKTSHATSCETQSSSSGASSSASPPEQQSQETDEDELLVDAFGA